MTSHEARRTLRRGWFQMNLVDQRSFQTVLEGAEMETPRPNASFIESQRKTVCPFLKRMTINTFAVPLGLSSQAQLWGSRSHSFLVASAVGGNPGIAHAVQWAFWILSLALLIVISLLYMAKIVLHWNTVKREWAHPVRSSFTMAPILTALTLIVAEPQAVTEALHPNTAVPFSAFLVLGGFMLYLEMALYGKWLFDQETSLKRANPSYQIAVVGNFLLASVGSKVSGSKAVETACAEISRMFFAVGILYQLVVFVAIQHSSAGLIAQPLPVIENRGSSSDSIDSQRSITDRKEFAYLTNRLEARAIATTRKLSSGRKQMALQGNNGRRIWPQSREPSTFFSALKPALSRVEVTLPPDMAADIMEMGGLIASDYDVQKRDGVSVGTDALASSHLAPPSTMTPTIRKTEENTANYGGQGAKVYGSMMGRKARGISRVTRFHSRGDDPKTPLGAADRSPAVALLSTKLHPIYFLFVAPPAAASIAWKGISGDFDMLAKSLFFISGFLYMFIALFNSNFLSGASFSIAWWAYTFPSSAFAFAALMYSEELDIEGVAFVAFVLSVASTLMVLVVFAKTVSATLNGRLFGPDPVASVYLPDFSK